VRAIPKDLQMLVDIYRITRFFVAGIGTAQLQRRRMQSCWRTLSVDSRKLLYSRGRLARTEEWSRARRIGRSGARAGPANGSGA